MVPELARKITVKYEQCTGCRICEIICSLSRFNHVSHSDSRINVYSFAPGLDIPILCVHCDQAPCIDSCPVDAIRKNEQGLVEIVDEECIGCADCIQACPAGAIKMHSESGIAFKCDLCDGSPKCVDYCPNNAIDYRDVPFDTRVYAKKVENIAKSLRKGLFGLEG